MKNLSGIFEHKENHFTFPFGEGGTAAAVTDEVTGDRKGRPYNSALGFKRE